MKSTLEKKFVLYWDVCKGPFLQEERRLVPGRRFRCDYVHERSKTVIELEGFGKGHQGIGKFIQDAEKYLEITLIGYRVIRLTTKQITVPILERIIAFLKEQTRDNRRTYQPTEQKIKWTKQLNS
jgi:very-short-patch-repair endonuclease